jgi:hypothetical protein
MTTIFIAPGIKDSDVSIPPTFEEKVRIFNARMVGWKLAIADALINGYTDTVGSKHPGIPEAGYAVMDIIFTYFEPIAKYACGCLHDNKSGVFFKKGVHLVFPRLNESVDAKAVKYVEETLWEAVRCGIYHSGMTKGNVMITGEIQKPIYVQSDQSLAINPHLLVKAVMAHLEHYTKQLVQLGPSKQISRNFIARFDHDHRKPRP